MTESNVTLPERSCGPTSKHPLCFLSKRLGDKILPKYGTFLATQHNSSDKISFITLSLYKISKYLHLQYLPHLLKFHTTFEKVMH